MPRARGHFGGLALASAAWFAFAPGSSGETGPPKEVPVKAGKSVSAVLPDKKASTLTFLLAGAKNGPVTIEARSLDFDTTLKVFAVGAGTDAPLKFDDDGGIGTNSRIDLEADGRTAFRIEVGSTVEWGGEFSLSVTKGKAPVPSDAARREQGEEYFRIALERARGRQAPIREMHLLRSAAMVRAQQRDYVGAIELVRQSRALWNATQTVNEEGNIEDLMLVGSLQRRAGALEEARATWEQAFAAAEAHFGADSGKLVPSLELYGDFQSSLNDYEKALALYRRAARLAENDPDWITFAARMHMKSANMLQSLGRPSEAESALQACSGSAVTVFGAASKEAAIALLQFAYLREDQRRWREAEQFTLDALEISRKLADGDVGVGYTLSTLGRVYAREEKNALAEDTLKRALAALDGARDRREAGKDQAVIAETLAELGELYITMGRYRDAQPLLERAVVVLRPADRTANAVWDDWLDQIEEKGHAQSLRTLGRLYVRLGRYPESESVLRKSLEIRERTLPATHWQIAQALDDLGDLLIRAGRTGEAVPLLVRALAIDEHLYGPDSPAVADVVGRLALARSRCGDRDEAEAGFLRAVAIRERGERGRPSHAVDLNDLGVFYLQEGRTAEAEPLIRDSLEISRKANGPSHPETATTEINMAVVEERRKNWEDAEHLLLHACETRRAAYLPSSPPIASCLQELGALYRLRSDRARAETYLRQALAMWTAAQGSDHPSTVACRKLLNATLAPEDADPAPAAEGESMIDSR